MHLANRPGNHTQFYIFGKLSCYQKGPKWNSGSDKTKIPEVTKLCPLTVGWANLQKHSKKKDNKIGPVIASKKEPQSDFCHIQNIFFAKR